MSLTVSCYRCGRQYQSVHRTRCDCEEPLWMDTLTEAFDWNPNPTSTGMWSYTDVLPFDSPPGICASAGGTPLTFSAGLSDDVGCSLWLKDETQNPTGTYKDRGSAMSVTYATQHEIDAIGTVSVGNMAMSTAATAASAGLGCLVLVPSTIPPERVELIGQYEPTLLEVHGDYGRLYYDALALNETEDVLFVNGDSPLRLEGYKTLAYEVCEQFHPETPDALVLPASSGGHACGVWKGLRELHDAGAIESIPRLYLVQASAANPIATAYEADSDVVEPVEQGKTIAYSISNGDPPSGNRALAAVRRTGGSVTSVSDAEILDAKRALATRSGLCVEPASAVTVAGIRTWVQSGEIDSDETVVAVLTGTGFKEMGRPDAAGDVGRRIDQRELRSGVRAAVESMRSD